MKVKMLLIVMGFALTASAQKEFGDINENSLDLQNEVHRYNLIVADESMLRSVIMQQLLKDSDIQLVLNDEKISKAFVHYTYKRTLKGKEIYAGDLHAAVSKDGILKVVQFNSLPDQSIHDQFPTSDLSKLAIEYSNAQKLMDVREVYFPKGDRLLPAIQAVVGGPGHIHRKIVLNESGVLFEQDLVRHFTQGPGDTTVSAYVFNPDPLTTAQVNYGVPYVDNNDMDSPQLLAERKLVAAKLTYENGLFKPKNHAVKLVDFASPVIPPVSRVDDQFLYKRSESGFEDMNALYHLTNQKDHITALGYPNLPADTVEVDPHGYNGLDNSRYTTFSGTPRIEFGEGGVDDAEDADVIIHEYIHAVVDAATSSKTTNIEARCLEEALGDYFAASYSNQISTFNRDHVFSWDGHNTFWVGRMVSSTKDYQQLSFTGGIYQHTDIFSSCLIEIHDHMGRQATDELVLESLFYLSSFTTMPQMANFVLMADTALNGGINFSTISNAFIRRNILPGIISIDQYSKTRLEVFGTYEFSKGGALVVQSTDRYIKQISLMDMQGRTVMQLAIGGKSALIGSNELKTGLYGLHVEMADGSVFTQKVVKITP